MDTVVKAQADFKKAEQEIANLATEAQRLKDEAASASPERQAEVDTALANVVAQQLAAHAALKTAEEQLKITTERSQPRDIVDIVVTEPITIRVLPTEVK
jgi:multidrug efflux pump subunit AcrA (membrane-fusion protein)